MKPKTKSSNKTLTNITVNKKLDEFSNKKIFAKKIEEAKEIVANLQLTM